MDKTVTDIIENTPTLLQVLICTYGENGIKRVASSDHPAVPGVKYLVSWQDSGNTPIPANLEREDFSIHTSDTHGLSVNRNIALSLATAPLLLIGDDDVDYTEEGLKGVMEAFDTHPDMDILTFRYESSSHSKFYPASACNLATPEKGYFVTSFEIAVRKDSVKGKIWFNENLGIGSIFPSGEEDIFIRECLDAGLKGLFIPLTINRHDGTTTSERNLMLPTRPQTKGAVFLRLHPHDWPLRMIAHAIRELPLWRKGLVPSPLSYCRNWIKGVRIAQKKRVFPTPDYSSSYLTQP